ncbi:P-loop containing nucleoside triphosphate hydrolase protein [Boletus edulis]|nr:P-loop containing nucleoside triphosphate hydrolase protein [Boletus edulis]
MIRGKDRFNPHPDDFIIVIMGPTGSGKSNFINNLTGNTEGRKASHLKSDTKDVTPYLISYRGHKVVLVDTPGFDDTYRSDSDILRVIADWLIQKYPDGTSLKIAGIIYVHRITDNRMSGSAYKNLQMFGRLCGTVPLPRTRLITTMWDKAKDQNATVRRETQLRDDFWRQLIEGGASMYKFRNTNQSAQEIVESLLEMGNNGEELLLQEELLEQQKRLNETEAGKMIYNRLQKLLADQKKMVKDLAEEAKQQNNPDLVKSLQAECDKIDAQLQKTFEDIKEMKIPLPRRILLWLFGRKSGTVSWTCCHAPCGCEQMLFCRKLLTLRKLSYPYFVNFAICDHCRPTYVR